MHSEGKKFRRVVVIGGGISGLAAAHRFIERSRETSNTSLEVLLLERSSRVGGTIRTRRQDEFLLETGPDSFISEKPEALELARRIGLEPRLIQTNPTHRRSFIVRKGRLLPVPEGFQLLAPSRLWPFATSKIFSWRGKARMALELILPRRTSANGSTDESLAEFVRRRFGREALERMAQPMVGGIYTADPEKLSLKATMPRFLEMERRHRSLIWAMWTGRRKVSREEMKSTSGARYSLFLSFDEGMQLLSDTLAARLPDGALRLNTCVERISFDKEKKEWAIQTDVETIRAGAVCLALPGYAAGALLGDVDTQLASELEAIPYASTATINFGWRREDIPHPLDGFGFVVPFNERRTILACTFTSVKFKGRAPEGHALLRAFVGGALQPEMFALDEEEMTRRVLQDLRELLGIERPPLFSVVEKWPRSMAQYMIGHLERVARIKQRVYALGTLQLAGNAYHGAGLPDCIRGGERAADEIIKALR
ncbi:MAG TPA: protoporphyrinogen oxidase [Pyrinomonadaceae bacterium]|jgi:oxygen-dependent protoporphyrinogen oxidase